MFSDEQTRLPKAEEELMHLLWEAGMPLTTIEILEASQDKSWNGNYLHKMLRVLLKKGFLEVCGVKQHGTKYVRQFRPMVTKESYAANFLYSQDLDLKSFAKIALALVRKDDKQKPDDTEELISELEEMIEKFTEQEKNVGE